MTRGRHRALLVSGLAGALGAGLLAFATARSLRDLPVSLDVATEGIVKPVILARDGARLTVSLQNAWNTTDVVDLRAMPEFLKRAFVVSEDQHFYEHQGVDWPARFAAAWQNTTHGEEVRGASTITEQVVRLLHPRPRTVWSRWLEGFEAKRLNARFSKTQQLTFYLNQVPYADRRRGVLQAARYYYDRDLETLSRAEILSLVVLVRSPYGMDLRHSQLRAAEALSRLADRLVATGDLTLTERQAVRREMHDAPLQLTQPHLDVDASHFATHVLQTMAANDVSRAGTVQTTLDAYLQGNVQQILDTALDSVARRKVHDGAVLVIDHSRNEILAWVVGHEQAGSVHALDARGLGYDTVLTRRQPGSTLKPLLYAMALERGWTASTLIDDSELSEAIGAGLHTFRNYSRVHYGPIRLREALGNSLNVPAVKTLKFVGTEDFLGRLHQLGVGSLQQRADFYGDGLALGNGEVSLYEMAQAYTVLARQGRFRPLTPVAGEPAAAQERQVYSAEVASLMANILSDPDARTLEFGRGLQFPVQTAVKTGTSSDYRDAWAIGFDYGHTVAVWMGNLDNTPMDGVTGSVGPAMVLRSVFAQLNRNQETRGLWLSQRLVSADICRRDGRLADGRCESIPEWFVPGTRPQAARVAPATSEYRLVEPTAGLQLARDPRIPAELEAFTMSVAEVPALREVAWYIDGAVASRTRANKLVWPLVKGRHEVYAQIWSGDSDDAHSTPLVRFYVH